MLTYQLKGKEEQVGELGNMAHRRKHTNWRGGRGRSRLVSLEMWHVTEDSLCHRPRALGSSSDQSTLVSVGTGQSSSHSFVLPSIVPCTISIGAASCSLAQTSVPCYHCPLSCSLYCIGMTCGSPCSSPDY